jgi:demethylmenaquinone methyltransferase/2-methoxy-6-polyprenyl-1,4-benzoquinol methylase
MFDGVARRYDRTNTVLSLGLDRSWRRATRAALALQRGERCLDIAAGTGVSTQELALSGAHVVGADLSLGMLTVGKTVRPAVDLLAADALALPFPTGCFDAVTVSFGLRNFVDPAAGLAELARVTRPGGRLVVCEFSAPTNTAFRRVYLGYLVRALPVVARRVSSSPEAYVNLAESIRAWPNQADLAAVIAGAGWTSVAWRNVAGGIVALHHATRPR